MSNAQGYRPDFKEVKKLIDSVIRLDDAACSIITEQELQLDSVKKACGIYRIQKSREALSQIAVDELNNAKSGIRVARLKNAGYTNLKELDAATDSELRMIDGIGDKQLEAIRNVIAHFTNNLSGYTAIRLSADDDSPENMMLMSAVAVCRRCRKPRMEISELKPKLDRVMYEVIPEIRIKNRLKWIFSGREGFFHGGK